MPSKCAHDGCTTRPHFNHPGETKGMFCSEHKREGMVDVDAKQCAHEGCSTLNPVFNHPGETRGMFCSEHKREGMVNVRSKQCAHEGCTKTNPVFNHPGETKGMFCGEHKREAKLSVLLEWNAQFPPDEWELRRNSVIRSYQGNDNPFILDHTLAERVDWGG
jgi:hypothetical protein